MSFYIKQLRTVFLLLLIWNFVTGLTSPEVIFFEADLNDDNLVELKWETRTGSDKVSFAVERSQNGMQYKEIFSSANTETNADQTRVTSHKFIDIDPLSGITYYRLKRTDEYGAVRYLEPRVIFYQPLNRGILNNPSYGGILYYHFPNCQYGVNIIISDSLEKTIFEKRNIEEVNGTITTNLGEGTYWVTFKTKTGLDLSQKWIVK